MSVYSYRKRERQAKAAARQAFERTQWPDAAILHAIKVGNLLTDLARSRALELAAEGLLDSEGSWKLTPAGEEKLQGWNDLLWKYEGSAQ